MTSRGDGCLCSMLRGLKSNRIATFSLRYIAGLLPQQGEARCMFAIETKHHSEPPHIDGRATGALLWTHLPCAGVRP